MAAAEQLLRFPGLGKVRKNADHSLFHIPLFSRTVDKAQL